MFQSLEGCFLFSFFNFRFSGYTTGNHFLSYLFFSFQYPPCYKDVSFWISESFTENNLCEVVREVAGDLAEEVFFFFMFSLVLIFWKLGS